MKLSIYPTKDEFRGAAEAYLKESHPEFINNLSEIRWTSYYDANIYPNVSFCIENLLLYIQNTE